MTVVTYLAAYECSAAPDAPMHNNSSVLKLQVLLLAHQLLELHMMDTQMLAHAERARKAAAATSSSTSSVRRPREAITHCFFTIFSLLLCCCFFMSMFPGPRLRGAIGPLTRCITGPRSRGDDLARARAVDTWPALAR